MTTSKKRGWIIWGVVTVIIMLPLFYLGLSFYKDALKYKRIENYYHANKESFDLIVEYYENLYQENLYEVKYDCDNSYLEYKLKYTCKFRMNGTPVTLQRCEGFASSVCQALTPAY